MPGLIPTLEQLKNRLAGLVFQATSFEAVAYRASTPKYATEADLLTGEGSKQTGGRWNPKGIAVVYMSLTPETAMAECLANHRYYGIAIEDAMPRVFVAIAVKLRMVLDLRVGAIRQRLRVSEERISTVDWRREEEAGCAPITQLLGRAAHEQNWEGLVVPSASDPNGNNLLVLPGNLQPGSTLTLLNLERLKA